MFDQVLIFLLSYRTVIYQIKWFSDSDLSLLFSIVKLFFMSPISAQCLQFEISDNCLETETIVSLNVIMENFLDYSLLNETLKSDGDKTCGETEDITSFNFTEFDFPNPQNMMKPFTWKEYCKIILYVVAIAAVMIGNIGVILAVALNRSLRITINYYLVNLAVADILICLCCMWTHLVNHLTEPLYVLGPIICKFNGFAQSKLNNLIHYFLHLSLIMPLRITCLSIPSDNPSPGL